MYLDLCGRVNKLKKGLFSKIITNVFVVALKAVYMFIVFHISKSIIYSSFIVNIISMSWISVDFQEIPVLNLNIGGLLPDLHYIIFNIILFVHIHICCLTSSSSTCTKLHIKSVGEIMDDSEFLFLQYLTFFAIRSKKVVCPPSIIPPQL